MVFAKYEFRMFQVFITSCIAIMLVSNSPFQSPSLVMAKEVEVTSEWTLLTENDSIPAGVHTRIDMTTGEKWVKLIEEDDDDDQNSGSNTIEVDHNGNVLSTRHTSDALAVTPHYENTDAKSKQETQFNQTENERTLEDFNYDYDMMHRTLSKLPEDEQERIGGMPQLPRTNSKSYTVDREEFEERMKKIWILRQEELQELQKEMVADMPKLLMTRIASIVSYLEAPYQHLIEMDLEEQNDNNEDVVTHIVSVLKDLEYQLADLDMARDFHTLGGWPLLVSLISEAVHEHQLTGTNYTRPLTDELHSKVSVIQAYASWAVGTMVKNTEEFYPYALEEVPVTGDDSATALSLLLELFLSDTDSSKKTKQKALYGLGSLLRGNRLAQGHFTSLGGASQLSISLASYCSSTSMMLDSKIATRIIVLADDIVSDVVLHSGADENIDKVIIDAFTTDAFCASFVALLSMEDDQNLRESALRTVLNVAPYCQWDQDKTEEAIKLLETIWRSENQKGMDKDHLQERLDLAEFALTAVKAKK